MKFLLEKSSKSFSINIVWALIGLIGVSVAGIEISTLGHLKASLISNLHLHGSTITLAPIIAAFTTTIRLTDLLFLLLLASCLLIMGIAEIRQSLLSNLFEWAFAKTRRTYLLLFVICTVGTLYYWVPGYILARDASSHVPGVYFVTDALQNGHSLSWSNYWSMGGPSFLRFYGPLYFLVAGAMGMIFGDATLGTKAVLWAIHVFSGFATFLYAKQISNSTRAAFIAGIIYVYAFAHTHLILWKGALPQALIFAFFPLALFYLEKVFCGTKQRKALCAFAAVSALLIISHPGSGLYSGWFIGLYILGRLFSDFKEVRAKLIPLAVAGLISLVISSFVVIPMRYEMSLSVSAGQLSQSPFPAVGLPTLETVMHALVWYNAATGVGHDNVAYLGVTSVILALFGLWYYLPKRNSAVISLLVLLVSAFVIQASHIREVIFVLTAISVLAGMGVLALEAVLQKRDQGLGSNSKRLITLKPVQLTVIILGFVLLDLGPTTIQSLYRTDKEYILEMGKKLEKTVGSARIVEGEFREDGLFINVGSGGSPLLYFRIPLVFGPYLAGPWTQNYAAVLVTQVFAELNKDRMLSELAVQGLDLLNVRYILINSRSKYILPNLIPSSGYFLNEAIPAVELNTPRFVWFSSAVSSRYDLPGDLENLLIGGDNGVNDPGRLGAYTKEVYKVIADMGLDSEKGTAKQFFVKDTRGYVNMSRPVNPKLEVSKISFDVSRVAVDVTTNMPGFVQLSYPYYPYLEVLVNGVKTEPLVGAIPFIVIPINAGNNNISLTPHLSPVRKFTLLLSGLAALALLVVFLRGNSSSVTRRS